MDKSECTATASELDRCMCEACRRWHWQKIVQRGNEDIAEIEERSRLRNMELAEQVRRVCEAFEAEVIPVADVVVDQGNVTLTALEEDGGKDADSYKLNPGGQRA